MGNCSLRPPASWADDELDEDGLDDDSDDLRGEKSPTRMTGSGTKVRIRINKKQLQELLRGARIKRISILDLMRIGEVSLGEIQTQYWRPALQSIPEEYDQSFQL